MTKYQIVVRSNDLRKVNARYEVDSQSLAEELVDITKRFQEKAGLEVESLVIVPIVVTEWVTEVETHVKNGKLDVGQEGAYIG